MKLTDTKKNPEPDGNPEDQHPTIVETEEQVIPEKQPPNDRIKVHFIVEDD